MGTQEPSKAFDAGNFYRVFLVCAGVEGKRGTTFQCSLRGSARPASPLCQGDRTSNLGNLVMDAGPSETPVAQPRAGVPSQAPGTPRPAVGPRPSSTGFGDGKLARMES